MKSKLPYIAVVLFALIAFFWFQKYRDTRRQVRDPQGAQRAQIKGIVEAVGKLVELPSGEEPTLATVTNVKALADQPFFAQAKVGDKVLIYLKTGRAILYRPSTNKVINVSTIDSARQGAGSVAGDTAIKEQDLQIAIYYVKKDDAKLRGIEETLRVKLPKSSVVTREQAGNTDYKKILVVDLDGTRKATAQALADSLGGQTGLLPLGETKPAADLLIILP